MCKLPYDLTSSVPILAVSGLVRFQSFCVL